MRGTTTGEIINLMQVNTQSLIEFNQNIHILWSAPLEIFLVFVLIWFYVGWAVLSGLVVLFLSSFFSSFISSKYSRVQILINKVKDTHIKMVNEILNGIKVLKFYGWEESFERLITKIKSQELQFVRKLTIFLSIFRLNFSLSNSMFTVVTLATFMYTNDSSRLDPSVAFVCMSLFKSIGQPLYMIGVTFSQLVNVIILLFLF